MITGFTSDKLEQIRSYRANNPYQIGLNGITAISYDPTIVTAITSISYTIGNINYTTKGAINMTQNLVTTFNTNYSGNDFEPYSIAPNTQNTFDVKEESKMGVVFPPKVRSQIFIERTGLAVFERHSRLSEINSLADLINYKNGYYNIVQKF